MKGAKLRSLKGCWLLPSNNITVMSVNSILRVLNLVDEKWVKMASTIAIIGKRMWF